MVTREAVQEFVGYAVLVKTHDGELAGVMRSVTPRDELVLANHRGFPTFLPLAGVAAVEDARSTCGECGARVNNVFTGDDGTQRCASCERRYARTLPPPQEPCEECGTLGAFYSPRAKRFACAQCHAKQGALTGLGVEARVLAASQAACHGADTEDDRHRWYRIKGHRWHCKNCPARRFNDPPLGTIWREPRQ